MFLSLNEGNILEAKHDCVMQDFDDRIFKEKMKHTLDIVFVNNNSVLFNF